MSASSTHAAHALDLNVTGVTVVFSEKQVRTQLHRTQVRWPPPHPAVPPVELWDSIGHWTGLWLQGCAPTSGSASLGFTIRSPPPPRPAWWIPVHRTWDEVTEQDPEPSKTRDPEPKQLSLPGSARVWPSRSDEVPRSCVLNYFYGWLEF